MGESCMRDKRKKKDIKGIILLCKRFGIKFTGILFNPANYRKMLFLFRYFLYALKGNYYRGTAM